MKQHIKRIAAHFAILASVYAVLSFWNWSLNMGDWGEFSRVLMSVAVIVVVIKNIDEL